MTAEWIDRMDKKTVVEAVSAGIGVVHIPERLVDDAARLGHTDS
jgi:DNA-binding transcriptional LysR family regulator